MKKRNDELETLFGNEQLSPSPAFNASLRAKLLPRAKKHQFGWRLAAGSVVVAILLIAGATFLLPQPKRQVADQTASPAKTILMKDLLGSAAAMKLPLIQKTTFWDITTTDTGGPQELTCTNYDRSTMPVPLPVRTLVFQDKNVTALYISPLYHTDSARMRYSDDPAVPAFREQDIFGGTNNTRTATILAGAVPTDRTGKPLANGARVPARTTGVYDVYATYSPEPSNSKDYNPACRTLRLHITIDATTGLYRDITAYREKITPSELVYSYDQTVKTSNIPFSTALPIMQAAGFNLDQAKATNDKDGIISVVNAAAGYEIQYNKADLGTATLSKMIDTKGVLEAYQYRFSKQPQVLVTIRTGNSTFEPATVDALRAQAQSRNWQVNEYPVNDDSHVPGCQAGDTEKQLLVSDGTTDYYLSERTCGQFPSYYVTFPASLATTSTGPITGLTLVGGPIPNLVTFTPGTEPPAMH
jgi:hypothetical protein